MSQSAERAMEWIGHEEVQTDKVSSQAARQLAATLDLPTDGFDEGKILPPGWHVALFPPLAGTDELGSDGVPKKSNLLDDLALPRRMLASRRMSFHRPLCVGDTVRRLSRVQEVKPKQGRSGFLVFIDLVHEISGPHGLALTEEQKVVYRGESKEGYDTRTRGDKPQGSFPWRQEFVPSSALLFRYSAVTFNAHRIHYDRDFARNEEGYPDLVVNGGLTAISILRFASDWQPGWLAEFVIRNKRPMFVDRPITLLGRPISDGENGQRRAEFCAVDDQGFLCSVAMLAWAGPEQSE